VRKLLLSTASNPDYDALLEITLPGKAAYARRHGYVLQATLKARYQSSKPVGWWKIDAMIDLLTDYDQVLWLGADVLICDGSIDLASYLHPHHWQALAMHNSEPNNDVWLVTRATLPILRDIANDTSFHHHFWAEQAALLARLGYDTSPLFPPYWLRPTPLWVATCILPSGWNWHPVVADDPGPIYFRHAAAYPLDERRRLLQAWAATSEDDSNG
jgi:hypothetical protein